MVTVSQGSGMGVAGEGWGGGGGAEEERDEVSGTRTLGFGGDLAGVDEWWLLLMVGVEGGLGMDWGSLSFVVVGRPGKGKGVGENGEGFGVGRCWYERGSGPVEVG